MANITTSWLGVLPVNDTDAAQKKRSPSRATVEPFVDAGMKQAWHWIVLVLVVLLVLALVTSAIVGIVSFLRKKKPAAASVEVMTGPPSNKCPCGIGGGLPYRPFD